MTENNLSHASDYFAEVKLTCFMLITIKSFLGDVYLFLNMQVICQCYFEIIAEMKQTFRNMSLQVCQKRIFQY